MLCRDILLNVSEKLQDAIEPRRWAWESDDGSYSLLYALNAAIREIVMQRPDATAQTRVLALQDGFQQKLPDDVISLISIISNTDKTGNAQGRPIFRIEPDAMRTAGDWGASTSERIQNWAYAPLDNRRIFWVHPAPRNPSGQGQGKDSGLFVLATLSVQPVLVEHVEAVFPLEESFANAAVYHILADVLSGDHGEANPVKSNGFMQMFAQTLGIKLQTDLAFPVRSRGTNDASA